MENKSIREKDTTYGMILLHKSAGLECKPVTPGFFNCTAPSWHDGFPAGTGRPAGSEGEDVRLERGRGHGSVEIK